ncbi:hypothetical protein LRAMOSA03472 [Lichtheimia ramosa]|uniref:Uncharacterized protein n=1 Tax=Lichtheimia ramosa TaxID=688394 RepID=A0A077WVB8_9FUNG|nr:hypothetical protein LRAMOSA03472 [Lichtheimia ramosa]
MATCYYSIKSYKYYCLFRKIGQSRTRVEHVAFFVFFTLKGWKRLMIAEAPRQVINIVTLASALIPKWIRLSTSDMSDPLLFHITVNNRALGKTFTEQIMTGTMAFSVLVFAISFMLVCFAALLYFPLLCHIQGNLKEYCCHKVDKRIAGLLRKQAQKRTIKNEKRALHHHQHRPQPTLPQVDLNPYPTYNSSSDRACLMAYPQPPPVSYPSYSHHHW